MWRSLDSRYDQCVGHCECLPGRDMPDEHITLHFSCLQNGINKPGGYATEAALGQMMYDNALSCTRHYSWHVWYQQFFVPAFGRLPEPHWAGNPIPAYNETHDEIGEHAARAHPGSRAAAPLRPAGHLCCAPPPPDTPHSLAPAAARAPCSQDQAHGEEAVRGAYAYALAALAIKTPLRAPECAMACPGFALLPCFSESVGAARYARHTVHVHMCVNVESTRTS